MPSKRRYPEPHVRIDLRFDHREGLDLNKVRKLLGVERVFVSPPTTVIF